MNPKVEDITDIYLNSAKILRESILSGDYKTTNREGKKLIKIFKKIEADINYGHKCIDSLLCCNDEIVLTKASSYCLALNYRVEDAEKILKEIAADERNGILGFNAGMTLQVWKEQGFLKLY